MLARPLSTRDSVTRDKPSLRAASLTVKLPSPRGSSMQPVVDVPSRMRRVAPQPGVVRYAALAFAHDALLVVVRQINIQHVAALDAKHDPPHA